MFAMWMSGTVQFTRRGVDRNSRVLFAVAAVLTALFIGMRYDVGGDWWAYQQIYNTIYFQPFGDALTLSDPGYAALNWLCGQAEIGIWAVNLVCGVLFMAGVGRLASRQPNPWLAVLVALPYLVIVVAMGYTRQAAAIGIISYGVADASERKLMRMIGFVAVAALFHKTAILMLPIIVAPVATRNLLLGAVGAAAFALLFLLVLGSASERLVTSYAQSNYDSQGAAIRIAMNVLAAGFLLALRNRMGFTPYQRSYWTYNAILALLSIIALLSLSASSGVDRLSLFLMPLQMVALSRLPFSVTANGRPSIPLLLGVIGYSFAIQFVWLNYADNAKSWLPYAAAFTQVDGS